MTLADLLDVCALLDEADVPFWVAGGWGVDVLAGAPTREHQDLDVAVDADRLDACLKALRAIGYGTGTDWLPVRVELLDSRGRAVDIHPVHFDASGDGTQAGLDGAEFAYPAADLVSARIVGRMVPCISVELQRRFRTGYEPRAVDVHDLAVLAGLTENR